MLIRFTHTRRPFCCCLFLCLLYTAAGGNQIELTGNTTESTNTSCSLAAGHSGMGSGVAALSSESLAALVVEDDAQIAVNGVAEITQTENGSFQIKSNLNISKATDQDCPSLENSNKLSQTQLIARLTAPCRYDRLEHPPSPANGTNSTLSPVDVYVRIHINVMQNLDTSDLEFQLHGLLQLRYKDTRLAFGKYGANRHRAIMGESQLRDLIWVPHIFLANEHDSRVLGTNEKDILTAIAQDGTVIITSRIQTTLFCWMDLKKFPFDEQYCSTVLESWMYNASEMMLHWEPSTPLAFEPKMYLTEYSLQKFWTNETLINADLTNLRHGSFIGQYSSLSFTVYLIREAGYYIMDYFLPSMMIVAISWVTFWLQADQTPARTTLGTTTLLSFITLASTQEKSLPKVSYIKVSEIWFLACTMFIFGSLIEFAFVNTIWRRKRSLELEKVNSKHIIKKTLTPKLNRPDIENAKNELNTPKYNVDKYLTVEVPVIITDSDLNVNNFNTSSSSLRSIEDNALNNGEDDNQKKGKRKSVFTMTPHEASLWIDRKARFMFPLAFLIFNAFFWTFVYCF